MRAGKIPRLKLVIVLTNCLVRLQARFSSRQEGLITVKSMEAVLSLSMKLLLLFYQIRYSRENNRHSFGFQKRKTTNGNHG